MVKNAGLPMGALHMYIPYLQKLMEKSLIFGPLKAKRAPVAMINIVPPVTASSTNRFGGFKKNCHPMYKQSNGIQKAPIPNIPNRKPAVCAPTMPNTLWIVFGAVAE